MSNSGSSLNLDYSDVEKKLLLLLLIDLMDLPMSRGAITTFIVEKELMAYYALEENLADLVEGGFLEVTHENAQDVSTTLYTLTDDGHEHLKLLDSMISFPVRRVINQYVEENRGKIQKSFEKSANYFPNAETGEFTVKCGVYDDKRGSLLMEVILPVATREQAKQIQANWNANYTIIYQKVLFALTDEPEDGEVSE